MNTSSKKCSKVVIDYRTSDFTVNTLQELGFEVVFTKRNYNIYTAIDGHADVGLCKIGESFFVASPENYDYYKKQLPDSKVLKGFSNIGAKYPENIRYNASVIGEYIIHNTQFTDSKILEYFATDKRINVKQGYSKCSICIVNNTACITADPGIYKILNRSIDVLKIREGFVDLSGMNYGFIGGASGLLKKDLLGFNGDIKKHPDYNSIHDFCRNHNVDIISLNNGTLSDIGSIIVESPNQVR